MRRDADVVPWSAHDLEPSDLLEAEDRSNDDVHCWQRVSINPTLHSNSYERSLLSQI